VAAPLPGHKDSQSESAPASLLFSLRFPDNALPPPEETAPELARVSSPAQAPFQFGPLLGWADEMAITRAGLQRQLGALRMVLDEIEQAAACPPRFQSRLNTLADQCGYWLQRQGRADRQLRGRLRREAGGGEAETGPSALPERLPALAEAVLVRLGEDSFAVPLAVTRGVTRLPRASCVAGCVYRHKGKEYPLFDLCDLLGLAPVRAEGLPQMPLLLLEADGIRAAIAVDGIDGRREMLIESIAPGVVTDSSRWLAGAALVEDGRGVGVLDVARLLAELVDKAEQGTTSLT